MRHKLTEAKFRQKQSAHAQLFEWDDDSDCWDPPCQSSLRNNYQPAQNKKQVLVKSVYFPQTPIFSSDCLIGFDNH